MLSFVLVACAGKSGQSAQATVQSQPTASLQASASTLPDTVAVPAPRLRTATRPLPHDIAQLRTVSSMQMSPAGNHLAYIVRMPRFDPAAKPKPKDNKAGWNVETQAFVTARKGAQRGSSRRQITFGKQAPSQLRWSPDGATLGFVRTFKGRSTIHLLPMSGGEARTLDLKPLSVRSYAWSPDGNQIAFTAEIPPSEEQKAARWRRGGARQFDTEWTPVGIYVVSAAGGEATRISPEPEPFGSVVQFAWSPDGSRMAVATAASADPYEIWTSHRVQILSVAQRKVSRVLEAVPSQVGHMEWSPNGRYLAYEWAENSLSMLNELRVRDVAGTGVWNTTARIDPTLMGFGWRDSESLIAHVYERTRSKLYQLSRNGQQVRELGPLGRVLRSGLTLSRDGRYVAAVSSTAQAPWAPTVIDLNDMSVRVVDDLNPQSSEWTLADTEIVRWKNPEGIEIEAILHLAPQAQAQAGTPPPLIVLPHGGPDSVSVDSFHSYAQYFAARGYSVLRPNYRGGLGYGRSFYEANRGRLGEIEYIDIESGVDALIAAGKVDPERLFFGGWSWGGYITTWTMTKTQRYRAAVVGAGVVDVVSQYVTSDINHGIVADWEYKGRPWQDSEAFARSNPALGLGAIKTPTLILHGRSDRRVDFMNGVMLYRALHDIGTKVLFWAYPREPHGFREPAHIAHMLEAWAHWYDTHQP